MDSSTLRVASSILLGALSFFTILGNYLIAARKQGSLVPFVGGVSGALAILLWPAPVVHLWFWIPLVIDLGSFPIVFLALAEAIRRRNREKP